MKLKKFQEFSKELIQELSITEGMKYDEDIEKFKEDEVQFINKIQSIEELDSYVNKITMGKHFPLNPIDPIRSSLREKIYELNLNDICKMYLTNLEGDWKEIILPPGAMY